MLAIFSNTPRSRKRRIAGTSSARAKHEFFFFAVCALPVQKKAGSGLPRGKSARGNGLREYEKRSRAAWEKRIAGTRRQGAVTSIHG